MSLGFDPSADAYLSFTGGSAGAAGTGAHTIAVIFKTATLGTTNTGLVNLLASGSQVRQIIMDSGFIFGAGDFSSGGPPGASFVLDTWYLAAITKPAGSAHYRCHVWPYASDGSGTMLHGESATATNHTDGSAITEMRVGRADTRGNGAIACFAVWNRELSDTELNSMKSNLLSSWKNVSGGQPAELYSFENWDGSTGSTAERKIGTSTFNSETGSVTVASNPPSFNFSISSTVDLVIANATQAQISDNLAVTQVHQLAIAASNQAQSADNLALTQVHQLAIDNSGQAQTADNTALTQVHTLVIANSAQAQVVDNLAILVVLNIADALQLSAVDNLIITQVHSLTIADARHTQSVDNISFSDTSGLNGRVVSQPSSSGAVTYAQPALAGAITE